MEKYQKIIEDIAGKFNKLSQYFQATNTVVDTVYDYYSSFNKNPLEIEDKHRRRDLELLVKKYEYPVYFSQKNIWDDILYGFFKNNLDLDFESEFVEFINDSTESNEELEAIITDVWHEITILYNEYFKTCSYIKECSINNIR